MCVLELNYLQPLRFVRALCRLKRCGFDVQMKLMLIPVMPRTHVACNIWVQVLS